MLGEIREAELGPGDGEHGEAGGVESLVQRENHDRQRHPANKEGQGPPQSQLGCQRRLEATEFSRIRGGDFPSQPTHQSEDQGKADPPLPVSAESVPGEPGL